MYMPSRCSPGPWPLALATSSDAETSGPTDTSVTVTTVSLTAPNAPCPRLVPAEAGTVVYSSASIVVLAAPVSSTKLYARPATVPSTNGTAQSGSSGSGLIRTGKIAMAGKGSSDPGQTVRHCDLPAALRR